MKALVTGASGFIGSHLVERLASAGIEPHALMRKTSSSANLGGTSFKRLEGDLSDVASLRKAVQGMDLVFHLAGATAAKNRDGYFTHNAKGTENLARAVAAENPKLRRFIYVSSLAAGGPAKSFRPRVENEPDEPVSAYGESKLQAEKELLVFKADFPVTVIRPPVVFGPKDKNVFLFIQGVARRVVPMIRGATETGDKYYSIIHVRDLVSGILQAATPAGLELPSGEIFYLSNTTTVTYDEIISTIATHLGRRPLRVPVPQLALKGAAASMTLISNLIGRAMPLNNDKLNELLPDYWVCSNQKAQDKLGFRPEYDFFSGMGDAIRWYRDAKWI
jgi:dihydroflavonol-4-reductase